MKCSIIIPVHGHPGVTRQCLERVIATTSTEIEVIVVNDGGPDCSFVDAISDRIRRVELDRNSGFAGACNAAADTVADDNDYLLFLNNDTLPSEGWLTALLDRAGEVDRNDILGARLLYPDERIQHAGVVVCQDKIPRHIYRGFCATHPAVQKSREFQAVTGACLMIARQRFVSTGGFDTDYYNGFEDIDLCLRSRLLGSKVHLCANSNLYHLESVSVAESKQDKKGLQRFLETWGKRIRPDDIDYYIADGLISVDYRDQFPIELTLAPELAVANNDNPRLEKNLHEVTGRYLGLLREATRLTVINLNGTTDKSRLPPPTNVDRRSTLTLAAQIESEIAQLQSRVGDLTGLQPGPFFSYRALQQELRATVIAHVPANACVAVISKGDDELIDLESRHSFHFPASDNGEYLGYYPANDGEAIENLHRLRKKGVTYLVVPLPFEWWLECYPGFCQHLYSESTFENKVSGNCLIFQLRDLANSETDQIDDCPSYLYSTRPS